MSLFIVLIFLKFPFSISLFLFLSSSKREKDNKKAWTIRRQTKNIFDIERLEILMEGIRDENVKQNTNDVKKESDTREAI